MGRPVADDGLVAKSDFSQWAKRGFHLRIIVAVTLVASVLISGAAWALWLVERDAPGSNVTTFPDAVWWAMETITTVGYGDHYPTTVGGRVVAGALMVLGLALVGVISATIVTWFFSELDVVQEVLEIEAEEAREQATLEQVLEKLQQIDQRLAALEERRT